MHSRLSHDRFPRRRRRRRRHVSWCRKRSATGVLDLLLQVIHIPIRGSCSRSRQRLGSMSSSQLGFYVFLPSLISLQSNNSSQPVRKKRKTHICLLTESTANPVCRANRFVIPPTTWFSAIVPSCGTRLCSALSLSSARGVEPARKATPPSRPLRAWRRRRASVTERPSASAGGSVGTSLADGVRLACSGVEGRGEESSASRWRYIFLFLPGRNATRCGSVVSALVDAMFARLCCLEVLEDELAMVEWALV